LTSRETIGLSSRTLRPGISLVCLFSIRITARRLTFLLYPHNIQNERELCDVNSVRTSDIWRTVMAQCSGSCRMSRTVWKVLMLLMKVSHRL